VSIYDDFVCGGRLAFAKEAAVLPALSAAVRFLSHGAKGMAAPKRSRTKIGFKTQYFEYRIEGGKSWIPFR
jgi:hypothetical protein